MSKRVLSALGWVGAMYIALVLQIAVLPQMALAAAVAAWAVSCSPAGAWWAAAVGVACDAAGHDRLGLHLTTYAVLAALGTALIPAAVRRTGSGRVALTALIASGDEAAVRTLALLTGRATDTLPQALAGSVEAAGLTIAVVIVAECVLWICRRLVSSSSGGRPLVLANRWDMLTE